MKEKDSIYNNNIEKTNTFLNRVSSVGDLPSHFHIKELLAFVEEHRRG